VYVVIGGKTLADWGTDGGKRITSALSASSLPVGTGGSPGDTVIVPANPIPAGLPDGVAVAARISDGAAVFALCDSSAFVTGDLINGDVVILGESVNFDKVSGGITYRYQILRAYARR
jgi:hypothetical protein